MKSQSVPKCAAMTDNHFNVRLEPAEAARVNELVRITGFSRNQIINVTVKHGLLKAEAKLRTMLPGVVPALAAGRRQTKQNSKLCANSNQE